jgi:hypothetical protein
MRRWCLIHWKNSSACERALHNAQMVLGGGPKEIGQEDQPLAGFRVFEADATQVDGVALSLH